MASTFFNLVQLEMKQTLEPNQMMPNYRDHLIDSIRKKHEKNFYRGDFIMKIYSIVEEKSNIVDRNSPMRNVIFTLLVSCAVCCPQVGKDLIVQLCQYVPTVLFAYSFPIKVVVSLKDINQNIFIEDGTNVYLKDEKSDDLDVEEFNEDNKINIGDYIKITIQHVEPRPDQSIFICTGTLVDVASKEEIKQFKKKDKIDQNDFDLI